jgi:hypothetical protein
MVLQFLTMLYLVNFVVVYILHANQIQCY